MNPLFYGFTNEDLFRALMRPWSDAASELIAAELSARVAVWPRY